MATETKIQIANRLRGEETLKKLNVQQCGILESLRESHGKIAISKFYPETKAMAIGLLTSLKDLGIVDLDEGKQEYCITDEGQHVALANLNAQLQAYNESGE